MTYKLITRMVEYASDANPDKRWSSTFVGVLPTDSRPKPEIGAMRSAMLPQYEFMCAALDEAAIYTEFLKEIMGDIERIEKGHANCFKESTEGWEFEIKPDGVQFEGLYDQGTGGEVSLAQFKLAVQTYLRFLQDLERKPIEVVFPD